MKYISNLFKGRLSLGNFWIGLLLPIIVCVPIGFIPNINSLSTSTIVNFIGTLLLIFISIYYLSLIIRRLHDHNKSGWFGLAVYIPIYGLYVLFLLFYMSGAEESNKYGVSPNKKIGFKNILGLQE